MPPAEEFNFSCRQCPRTFKLQDFYEKHQKVHGLKKQHVCRVCGYVYGAAKGLEGHLESAHGIKEHVTPSACSPPPPPSPSQSLLPLSSHHPGAGGLLPPSNLKSLQELPFGLGFQFLQSQGILGTVDQAKLAQESATLLQKAQQAMLVHHHIAQTHHHQHNINNQQARTAQLSELSIVPLTINPGSSPSHSSSSTNSSSNLSPQSSKGSRSPEDKSKIPSPAGTGNYKIYGKFLLLC